jgi:hypothetical protein
LDFVSGAFGGLGGFEAPVNSALDYRLRKEYAWSSTMFIAKCMTIPSAVVGSGSYVFQGGTSGAASLFARMFIDTSGRLFYGTLNGSTSTLINLGGDYRGGTYAFVANYVSLSQLDIYVYGRNGLVATHSVDPNDNFQNRAYIYYGGSCTGTIEGALLGKNESHDAVNDPSIGAIANQLLREHNSFI